MFKKLKLWFAFNKQRAKENKCVSDWFILLQYFIFFFGIVKIIFWDAPKEVFFSKDEEEIEYKKELKKYIEERL